jgi:hypothetical protein
VAVLLVVQVIPELLVTQVTPVITEVVALAEQAVHKALVVALEILEIQIHLLALPVLVVLVGPPELPVAWALFPYPRLMEVTVAMAAAHHSLLAVVVFLMVITMDTAVLVLLDLLVTVAVVPVVALAEVHLGV